jgi:hypothetical protein
MLNAKLLLGSSAFGAVAWQVGSDPRWLHVVLDVSLALAVSWIAFLAAFFLTAVYTRGAAKLAQRSTPAWRPHRLRSHAWRIRTTQR